MSDVFDPFGDFAERGYLRNHHGAKNPEIVKRLEHNAFARNIERALAHLKEAPKINLEFIQDTHRILFSDIYPWAGEDRSQNASQLGISRGEIEFQLAPYVQRGVEHALGNANDPVAFRADPGKVIGELAYAHPFLDGNGRTITAVVSELSRRAGFHIDWASTEKSQYLQALSLEINDPEERHLTKYLEPYIRENTLDARRSASSLSTLPGLSNPEPGRGSQPTLTIVAGPNGAGKSSLTASGRFGAVPVVDPDVIAREINPSDPTAAGAAAGRRALEQRKELLDAGRSFVVETTLSGASTGELIERAKVLGYRVELKYVGLSSDDLSVSRVAGRVAAGGHDVPEADVRRRFTRSRQNLPDAIAQSDSVEVFDNSGKTPHRLVASLNPDQYDFDRAPKWVADAAFDAAHRDLGRAETVPELERATSRALEAARAAGVQQEDIQREVKSLERAQERKRSREGHDL